jgi:3-oxoacyl-[acyl-carrier protein] reductase
MTDRDGYSSDPLLRFSLKGKIAVIVGAASGIGRQTAITFAAAGARLFLADLNEDGLRETAGLAGSASRKIDCIPLDVTDRAAVEALADRASADGPVDAWANVAGILDQFSVTDASAERLERVFSVNLYGTYWGCAAAARVMKPAGRGSIINISSAGADFPAPGLSAYAMTKAAVSMLTRTLAHEVGEYGVRVNAIAPGFIDTPMVTGRFKGEDGKINAKSKAEYFSARASQSVLKRVGEPIDIALAMLYLASEASSFMTGQVLRPNGGVVMPG